VFYVTVRRLSRTSGKHEGIPAHDPRTAVA
jgi:hypothetical protein